MTASLPMTEQQLQDAIVDLAHLAGWRVFHARPARTQKGWRTPVAYDGKGFFDLSMAHERQRRYIVSEIKANKGQLTPEQLEWHHILSAIAAEREGFEVYVWTPDDWSVPITEILTGLTATERTPA